MQKKLDVRELEPCEPLDQTLVAARQLQNGEYLRVWLRQKPNLLFPMLESLSLLWQCRERAESHFEVLIWRVDDESAEAEVALYTRDLK